MEVIIKPDAREMSRHAAEIIAKQIREKPDCVLGLATGSTPEGTYEELIRMHQQGLDFSRVTTFNLDEYWGIGIDLNQTPEQDQSYARFMYEKLFKHVNLRPENTNVPNGRVKRQDLENYCREYEQEIKSKGGIDIQLLGIGEDGHIAFNEPGSAVRSRTRLEPLDQSTIDINWESFYRKAGGKKEDMPHFAITMGIGTILEARNILLLANGKRKAEVIAQAIEGPIISQITSSYLQFHPNTTFILDKEAASQLQRSDHYRHI